MSDDIKRHINDTKNRVLAKQKEAPKIKQKKTEQHENPVSTNVPSKTMSQEMYNQKATESLAQLINISNQIEKQFNQFSILTSGDIDPISYGRMQIALSQNIDNLETQANKIFSDLIKLANETGNSSAVNEIQNQKRQFYSDVERRKYMLRDGVIGY